MWCCHHCHHCFILTEPCPPPCACQPRHLFPQNNLVKLVVVIIIAVLDAYLIRTVWAELPSPSVQFVQMSPLHCQLQQRIYPTTPSPLQYHPLAQSKQLGLFWWKLTSGALFGTCNRMMYIFCVLAMIPQQEFSQFPQLDCTTSVLIIWDAVKNQASLTLWWMAAKSCAQPIQMHTKPPTTCKQVAVELSMSWQVSDGKLFCFLLLDPKLQV